MQETIEPSKREILWRQYEQHTELYKFYFNLTLQANIFYFTLTGAILSYYFTHLGNGPIRYSLLLPIILSTAIGILFLYGAELMKYPREEMFSIRDELNLDTAPDFHILTLFLKLFGYVLLGIGFSIAILFFNPELIK